MKKNILLLFTLVLVFSSFFTVDKTYANHNGTFSGVKSSGGTTGWVALYNPDGGGFLASVAITVKSTISYRNNSSIYSTYDDLQIDSNVETINSSFTQCGGSISIRDYTRFNTSQISLTTNTSYINSSSYTIVGKHSNTFTYGPRPYSAPVEAEGYFYPNPSKCFGGSSVQDKWTFSR
jgi:hypothetical protein